MILTTPAQIKALLEKSTSVAMVGASDRPERPSHGVFAYLRDNSRLAVDPINPLLEHVDGIPAFPDLESYAAEKGAPDIVNVFRKANDAPGVTRQAIAAGAKSIWFQLGVVNDEAIRAADAAGLDVVVDRCIKIDHAALVGSNGVPR